MNLSLSIVANLLTNELGKEKITEKEIKSAYETFIADKKSREEISVKHILVKEENSSV